MNLCCELCLKQCGLDLRKGVCDTCRAALPMMLRQAQDALALLDSIRSDSIRVLALLDEIQRLASNSGVPSVGAGSPLWHLINSRYVIPALTEGVIVRLNKLRSAASSLEQK